MTIAAATRFWDRIAERYAADPIKDMAGYGRTLERTAALLKPADSVVEIGCGTGTTALRLAPSVSRIIASDVSPAMIAIARKKAEAQGCANVTFEARAAEERGGPAGLHDAVLAFNVLHLVADRAAVLAEAHRLLKPGGLFISKTPCLKEMNPLIRLAIPVMQLIGKAPPVDVFGAAELEAAVAAAGFTIIERDRHGSGRTDPRIFLVARRD
jgi:ubiquinone/menaquinone biosynthesis C-methylase UbiE